MVLPQVEHTCCFLNLSVCFFLTQPLRSRLPDGYSQISRLFATLQNLIPSFPWIAPPRPPPWSNPRKGRDQILPSSNTANAHISVNSGLGEWERHSFLFKTPVKSEDGHGILEDKFSARFIYLDTYPSVRPTMAVYEIQTSAATACLQESAHWRLRSEVSHFSSILPTSHFSCIGRIE